MDLTTLGVGKWLGERFAKQNANKLLERFGIDKVLSSIGKSNSTIISD